MFNSSIDTNLCFNPFWEIRNGYFVYPSFLEGIKSCRGQKLASNLSQINNGLRVFLRGSLVETLYPFEKSDADIFAIYNDISQLGHLHKLLENELYPDIKIYHVDFLDKNFVARALLECRSVQVCGLPWKRSYIPADKAFAWNHWLIYCPALIPPNLNTNDCRSLIFFKLITRCFGVISFLKFRRFTREISACIDLAHVESVIAGNILEKWRKALEENHDIEIDISFVKNLLHKLFDRYFHFW